MFAGQIKNEKIEQGRLHKVYTCTCNIWHILYDILLHILSIAMELE